MKRHEKTEPIISTDPFSWEQKEKRTVLWQKYQHYLGLFFSIRTPEQKENADYIILCAAKFSALRLPFRGTTKADFCQTKT